jgi:signal peptidase I
LKSKRTYLGGFVAAVLAIAVFFLVGPSQLGGPVTYVAVTGTSMEPSMHTGDLVIVRKAPSYEVGDVVAYRNPQLNSTVIHRIIRKEGDRYVFQGDNNDFVDTYRAAPEDIVGRRWILMGEAGKIIQLVRSPVGAAVLVMIIAAVAMSGSSKRSRKRKGKSSGSIRSPFEADSRSWLHVNRGMTITAAGTAAVLFAALGAVAFTKPPVSTTTSKVPYTESGKFFYEATAETGPVYPSGQVTTGQPIYMQLVDEVEFGFSYLFQSSAPHKVGGTASLVARLSDGNGWTRDFELAPEAAWHGGHWTGTGTVKLRPIRELVKQVESSTGVARDFYTLSIIPRVETDGTMNGHHLSTKFAPALGLQVGSLEMQVAPSTDPSSADGDALRPSQGGVVVAPIEAPSVLSLPGLSIDVGKARLISALGLTLALLLLALVAFVLTTPVQDEAAKIQAAFGKLMIPVRSVSVDPNASQVEVEGIEVLAGLARRYDRAILHQHAGDVHRYVLENEGTLYSYECVVSPNGAAPHGDAEVVDLYAPFDEAAG